MRSIIPVLLFTVLVIVCWGTYGPVLHHGKDDLSSLRQFICVGLAYFVIAVIVPVLLLQLKGEKGNWTATGTWWSLIAGAAGALGALGIVLALSFRGSPAYVMPLVFGGAPVVNTFFTMFMARTHKQASPMFLAGLILVVAGAVTVLLFRPHDATGVGKLEIAKDGSVELTITQHKEADKTETTTIKAESLEALQKDHKKEYRRFAPLSIKETVLVLLFTLMTAFSWGVYGPVLHKGQLAMAGSRLRPLLCVGLAYFGIAVVLPLVFLQIIPQEPVFEWDSASSWNGAAWSLAGGAVGAIGAIGVIMAFNFGGKPIYVMPLVFGGAPIVNTFVSVSDLSAVGPMFYAGLVIVAVGAVTVLVFAPKAGHGPPPKAESPKPEPAPA